MTKTLGKDKVRDDHSEEGSRGYKNVPVEEWTSNQVTQYIRQKQRDTYYKNITSDSTEFYTDEFSDLGFTGERRGTTWSKIKGTLFKEFKKGETVRDYIDWVFDKFGGSFDKPIPINIIICKKWRLAFRKSGSKIAKKKGAYGE